jgi:FKBP-type peptidyl-prolyl cis-trans isomerase
MKDNEDEIRAEEQRLLKQYIEVNNITVNPTTSGLYYIELLAGSGLYPKSTDWVEISYTAKLLSTEKVVMTSDSSVAQENEIFNEFAMYGPNRVLMSKISIGGLYEGLGKMKEGGKAQLIFPSSLGYGNIPFGAIPAYSSLIFDVELHNVISDIDQYERAKMNAYLIDNNIHLSDSTSTGLYYHEILSGEGENPGVGDVVEIAYKGYFLDGKVFDQTESDNYIFYVGYNQVISGMEEGIKLMKEGGKAKFVVPYYLAYGEEGYTSTYYGTLVWPYTTLVFEVELVGLNAGSR